MARLVRGGVVATLVCLSGCSHPTAPSTPVSIVRLRAEATSFMAISGYESSATFAIRDREAWQQAWSLIHRRVSPVPLLPDVDFAGEMIVVAALGIRPTSGYDIVFTDATERDGAMTIDVAATSPASSCVTAQVVTSPLDIARVPKRTMDPAFHVTTRVVSCP